MRESASVIYQANLDAVSQALWNRDIPAMLQHLSLPNQVVTEDAEMVIASTEEMCLVANDFRDHLEKIGCNRYLRVCRGAAFMPGACDMIQGSHDTYFLRGQTPLRPPYLNRMTLVLTATGWKGLRIEASARNADCPILSPDLAAEQRRELGRLFAALPPGLRRPDGG